MVWLCVQARSGGVGVRSENIVIGAAANAMSFVNNEMVALVKPVSTNTRVWTKLGGQSLAFRVEAEHYLVLGDRLSSSVDPTCASLFNGQNNNRM